VWCRFLRVTPLPLSFFLDISYIFHTNESCRYIYIGTHIYLSLSPLSKLTLELDFQLNVSFIALEQKSKRFPSSINVWESFLYGEQYVCSGRTAPCFACWPSCCCYGCSEWDWESCCEGVGKVSFFCFSLAFHS